MIEKSETVPIIFKISGYISREELKKKKKGSQYWEQSWHFGGISRNKPKFWDTVRILKVPEDSKTSVLQNFGALLFRKIRTPIGVQTIFLQSARAETKNFFKGREGSKGQMAEYIKKIIVKEQEFFR